MTHTVEIKLADDTVKEFIIGSDVELPTGLGLTASQITMLLGAISSLTTLISQENWKIVEIKPT